jgi:hypothetical protein
MNRNQFVTISGLLALILVTLTPLAWNEVKPHPVVAEELQPIGPQILSALKARRPREP